MLEVSVVSRYRLKAVAALRGITIKELVEQTAKELADKEGIKVPASLMDSESSDEKAPTSE